MKLTPIAAITVIAVTAITAALTVFVVHVTGSAEGIAEILCGLAALVAAVWGHEPKR